MQNPTGSVAHGKNIPTAESGRIPLPHGSRQAAELERPECPSWCSAHSAPSGSVLVHTTRAGVARHMNIRAAVFLSRRDENGAIGKPLISVSFKADPGALMLPDPVDYIDVEEALDLAGRWDLIRATELAEALRAAVAVLDAEEMAEFRTLSRRALRIVVDRHGERAGWLQIDLLRALLDGRVEPDRAVELGRALVRGELDQVEQAVSR